MLKPVFTEKSLNDAKNGSYTFWVDLKSTKYQIKKLIELTFKVNVTRVRVVKKGPELKKNWKRKVFVLAAKKAVVRLKDKEKIDIFEEVKN